MRILIHSSNRPISADWTRHRIAHYNSMVSISLTYAFFSFFFFKINSTWQCFTVFHLPFQEKCEWVSVKDRNLDMNIHINPSPWGVIHKWKKINTKFKYFWSALILFFFLLSKIYNYANNLFSLFHVKPWAPEKFLESLLVRDQSDVRWNCKR